MRGRPSGSRVERRRPPRPARHAPRRRCAGAAARAVRSAPTTPRAPPPACPRRTAWPTPGGRWPAAAAGPVVVAGPGRRHADVLLVHPAVHDPDVHELPVRDLPDGARADLVEARRRPRRAARPAAGPSPRETPPGPRARAAPAGCATHASLPGPDLVAGRGRGDGERRRARRRRAATARSPPCGTARHAPSIPGTPRAAPTRRRPSSRPSATMAPHSSARISTTGSAVPLATTTPFSACACGHVRCPRAPASVTPQPPTPVPRATRRRPRSEAGPVPPSTSGPGTGG